MRGTGYPSMPSKIRRNPIEANNWGCSDCALVVPNVWALQRSLLRDGSEAYYRRQLDIACHLPDVGCFGLKARMPDFEDRRVRARRRAAAGLSIARLIKRGLLECCARGSWRLTPAGLAVARRLYPDLKPPTKRQLATDIAIHRAVSQWADEHPALIGKRRRR
jgi:hypothetical protein